LVEQMVRHFTNPRPAETAFLTHETARQAPAPPGALQGLAASAAWGSAHGIAQLILDGLPAGKLSDPSVERHLLNIRSSVCGASMQAVMRTPSLAVLSFDVAADTERQPFQDAAPLSVPSPPCMLDFFGGHSRGQKPLSSASISQPKCAGIILGFVRRSNAEIVIELV
jgi:hypothetical protein